MGVYTTTTKTLNYSQGDPGFMNAVDATITSTPGQNFSYLGKPNGLIKLIQVILTIIALALVASQREEYRPLEDIAAPRYQIFGKNNDTTVPPLIPNTIAPDFPNTTVTRTYQEELFMVGEVYFLCAHTAVLVVLVTFLISYLFHVISSVVVPKTSVLEVTSSFVLALLLIVAGIVEIVMTVKWRSEYIPEPFDATRYLMFHSAEAMRLVAGSLALFNGILAFFAFVRARKELNEGYVQKPM
ncbi:uncharacterized protein LOC129600046 [Paramacrobiotus metropolitanus]|uniref:uncharacterized protein LOC129600046 n=1 Tax=Paramacrobiotus metropolitanus TaxID=2943436 RepID=UPI0024465461|nr:uncharacterized protein LOC129600046 [Paramacrobiotus metropolitanus]